jgi:hypothetical protein
MKNGNSIKAYIGIFFMVEACPVTKAFLMAINVL